MSRPSKEAVFRELKIDGDKLALSPNAIKILQSRYLLKDEEGIVKETPEELFKRVAYCVALPDLDYDPHADIVQAAQKFLDLMTKCEFMPNSPTLMNAGKENGQLSACFVLPIEDSMEGIFDAVKFAAIIHKTGGGTGFAFSRLRPANDIVSTTGGVASGPISFLKVFNQATEAVKQGGTRRGANMGILAVSHPDIMKFITCKKDNKEITNFNVSVGVDDKFMQAVMKGEDYDLVNPRTGRVVSSIPAKDIFERIIQNAWKNGEPGVVFLDRINADNPTPAIGTIEATNPCGEQPLLPYEACNLGSLNLAKMYREGGIDYDKLRETVHACVHFLDNVIDANCYPLSQIDRVVKSNRKIGLGVMGWADLLFLLGIPYDSDEATTLGEQVMRFVQDEANAASLELGRKRGPFPNYDKSIYAALDKPYRNSTRTTVAPTGTISMIAGASSGIEPLFAISFIKYVLNKQELLEVNSIFEATAKAEGFYSEDLMRSIAERGSIHGLPQVPDKWQRVFVTAHDVSPEWHVRMQAAFQKYTDNAVSKTVNLPNEATVDDVRQVYFLAYELGCKGVTVYRDASRESQVLNIGKVNKEDNPGAPTQAPTPQPEAVKITAEDAPPPQPAPSVAAAAAPKPAAPQDGAITPRKRPRIVFGATTYVETGCGKMYVTTNVDVQGRPFEVFAQMGKAGGCAAAQTEAITRLVSLALRSGVDTASILKQLRGISCPRPVVLPGGKRILSCPDAIVTAVEQYLAWQEEANANGGIPTVSTEAANRVPERHAAVDVSPGDDGNSYDNIIDVCPECGGQLIYEEMCLRCINGDYYKC
jgi:ribonucleoside-diphosphate reductase alpha chain